MMWPEEIWIKTAIILFFPSVNHLYSEEFAEIRKVKEQIIFSADGSFSALLVETKNDQSLDNYKLVAAKKFVMTLDCKLLSHC